MIIRPGVFISDRYEIIEKVGSGGMADVYKAKCHRLNRFVAIKILKAEFSDDKKFVEKFRAEAQSAAGLSQPNIVNVYDVGEEEGMYYIVMELVEGITLKSFIERKGKLDIKEAVGIAIQIAQGMESAHSNHIIHRDIKPQNIMISKEGKVKVTDFGIAKAVTSDTITSNAMGSVHYLSPEQARGGFSDEKSDIYSLGVTLYEMLAGRVPFIGDNTVSVALCHLQENPIPLRDLDPSIPVSLDRIVQKCLQKKPEHRYLSASDLIRDLKKSLSNPDGAYVNLVTAAVVDSSPTISISEDDLGKIKRAVHQNVEEEELYEAPTEKRKEAAKPVVKRKYEEEIEEDDEDDEDEEDMNPKLERLMSIGGVVVAFIIVIIIVVIIIKASGLLGGGGGSEEPVVTNTPEITMEPEETEDVEEEQVVPDVVNLPLDQVESQLEILGLTVVTTEQESDEVEVGCVISQDLEEGTVITEGMKINLVVSSGVTKYSITDVSNMTANEASTSLQKNGFLVVQDSEYSDTVESGKVVRTQPAAGERIAKGDTVTIYISKGPKDTTIEVPNLSNCTLSQATKKLVNVGLEINDDVAYDYSDTVEKNKVISQSHTVGSKVEKGTVIGVTISMGAEPTYRYVASISVADNPFTSEDETGVVKLILKQDGKSKTIYEESHSLGDFPLPAIEVEGYSDSQGEVYMYLDGVLVNEYTITFQKVAE